MAEASEALCACGLPLHYSDPVVRAYVDELVARLGPTVQVTIPSGSYLVPRHYIALHGLAAAELPALGFPRIGGSS